MTTRPGEPNPAAPAETAVRRSARSAQRPGPRGEQALAAAVEDLHRELEGLRASARLRAVIEQAKGVLVERHGISLDEAFDRLRLLSQEHNVRLVEVAATVVGITLPDDYGDQIPEPVPPPLVGGTRATSPAWSALTGHSDVRAKTAAAMFHGISSSLREGEEAARVVKALVEPLGVAGVLLYRLAPDGSLRLLGGDGLPPDFVSGWQAVPPNIDVPVVRAARTGEPVYVEDMAVRHQAFPITAPVRPVFEASASLPAVDPSGVLGVVVLVWSDPQVFDERRRAQLEHLVRTSGPVLMRSARGADPDLAWLGAVLELLFDPWVLLDPVYSERGSPVDFEVVRTASVLNDAGGALTGRRVSELWPALVESAVFQDLVRVERYGGVSDERVLSDSGNVLPHAGDITRVRVVRLGPRLAMHWRAGAA